MEPKIETDGIDNEALQLIPIGTKVAIVDSDVRGIVVKITLANKPTSIIYTIEWWDGFSLQSYDFHPFQVQAKSSGRMMIGFRI